MESLRSRAPSVGRVGYALVAVAVLAVVAVLAIDAPVQRVFGAFDPPGVVKDYFTATEAFGNGFGVAMIVLAIAVLDRFRRIQTCRLLCASLGAGLVADMAKLLVARTRPHSAAIEDLAASGAGAAETFVGWLPLAAGGNAAQSFPSAHTATAFGLAAALAIAYPAGRRMFFAFAAGVALQRVAVGAHYVSDVVVGAAVGAAWGAACYNWRPIAALFDHIEVWWSRRFGWSLPPVAEEDTPDVVKLPPTKPTPARRAA